MVLTPSTGDQFALKVLFKKRNNAKIVSKKTICRIVFVLIAIKTLLISNIDL